MRRSAFVLLLALLLLSGSLAGGGEQRDLEALARRVADPIARAELIWTGPAAVPHLLTQVASGGPRLAHESAATIRWIVWHWRDDAAARSTLVERLDGFVRGPAPPARRRFAVDALGDLGEDAVPALEWVLRQADFAAAAVLALERIPGETARRALVGALDLAVLPSDPVLEALGRRAEPESVDALIAAAAAGSTAAHAALAFYDGGPARDWLLEQATNGSDAAFAALLEAPGRLDGSFLATLLGKTPDPARRQRLLAAIEHPEQYDPALADRLLAVEAPLGADPQRLRALLALGPALAPDAAERVARAALGRPVGPDLTPSALRLCAVACEPAAASLVAAALASADADVRKAAVEALGTMEGNAASTEIRLALERDLPDPLRRSLVGALGRRSDPTAVEALLELLDSASEDLDEALLAATAEMAPRVDEDDTRRLWRAAVERRPTAVAIDGLAAVGRAGDVELLLSVDREATGPAREAVRSGLVEIGRRLAARAATSDADRTAAVSALERAFERGAPVAAELRRLGERVELVAHGGRIDAWWQTTVEDADCATTSPPATALEALEQTPLDTTRWVPRQSADPRGAVTLPPSRATTTSWLAVDVLPRGDVTSEITVLSSAPTALWLGGAELPPLSPARGQRANEQRFAARLTRGSNRLLLRICPAPEPVHLSVRLQDEEGRALKFRLR